MHERERRFSLESDRASCGKRGEAIGLDALGVVRIVKHMLDSPLDRVFHALSDPTRRQMLERLARTPASVSELAAPLTMSLAAVVQHVQVLEASGVVRTEKIGRTRMCRLEPKALGAAERWFAERRALWERRFDLLEDLLEEEPPVKRKKKTERKWP
jgi:DNA-binding transcriptional ArsR family regulator